MGEVKATKTLPFLAKKIIKEGPFLRKWALFFAPETEVSGLLNWSLMTFLW
jgi:hypothetical protein